MPNLLWCPTSFSSPNWARGPPANVNPPIKLSDQNNHFINQNQCKLTTSTVERSS